MTRITKTAISTCTYFLGIFILAGLAQAASLSADVHEATVDGQGKLLGTITFADSADGMTITTDLQGLPPGVHGFHVHQNPDCGPNGADGKTGPALAAGGHFDPDKTGKHMGPGGGGHKGDLPPLTVAGDGTAKETLQLKGVKAEEFANRSVMVHAGGDNFSDTPEVLGGGGARIGCGVIK